MLDYDETNYYHNPSFRLATKARAYKGVGQEWSMGITFHALMSVGECEGMNPHTPKWAPTLGVGSLDRLLNLQRTIIGVKPIGLKHYLYHWKALGM